MSGRGFWLTERLLWTSGEIRLADGHGYLCRKTNSTVHMRIALFSAGLALLSLACKDPKKARLAENDFYVRFIQDDNTVKATASFRAGEAGAKLAPRTMASVTFQDEDMGERQSGDLLRYVHDGHSNGFQREYKFSWKNDAGTEFSHKLRLSPILRPSLPAPWPSSGNAVVKWEGAPLEAGESLTVLCESATGHTYSQEFAGPTDLPAVPLNAAKIGAGKWKATLVKTRIEEKKEGPLTTKSVFEFYAEPVAFEVK